MDRNHEYGADDGDRFTRELVRVAIEGMGPFVGARDLANAYRGRGRYRDTGAMTADLVRGEAARSFGAGAIAGLGGIVTAPVSVPASVTAGLLMQIRLSAAVAACHGYDLDEERVRVLVLLPLMGGKAQGVLRSIGGIALRQGAQALAGKIPGKLAVELRRRIAAVLVARAGERGAAVIMRALPILGALAGAAADAVACYRVGNAARDFFGDGAGGTSSGAARITLPLHRVSALVSATAPRIDSVTSPSPGMIRVRLRPVPLVFDLFLDGGSPGELRLVVRGNRLKRALVDRVLARQVRKLPPGLAGAVGCGDGALTIDLGRLMAAAGLEHRALAVAGITVSGDTLELTLR